MSKQDWLDAMGVPSEFAYTFEYKECLEPDKPCACEACRIEAGAIADDRNDV